MAGRPVFTGILPSYGDRPLLGGCQSPELHRLTLVVAAMDSSRHSLARIAFLISHLSSTVCASRFSSLASSFFCYKLRRLMLCHFDGLVVVLICREVDTM